MRIEDNSWPIPPEHDKVDLPVWAVRPLGDRVRMRNATYVEAARYSKYLVERGLKNVWVYPELEWNPSRQATL